MLLHRKDAKPGPNPNIEATFLAAMMLFTPIAGAQAAPVFNLTFTAGTSAQAQTAFNTAANIWSQTFTDNVTIDLTLGFNALGAGILASAGSTRSSFTYGAVRDALIADATSAADNTAISNLAIGSGLSVYLNRTSNNPNGSGSATPYVDNDGDDNNTTIRMTNANAKALGLTPTAALVGNCTSACDASITFSTNFTFDFDPTDGITAGAYDFVGIALHEIGHALGFVSGVDILDINSPPVNGPFADNQFTFISTLDLFRCSTASSAAGANIDWTADNRTKNFSLDNCASTLTTFSTGRNFGDGQQASHWKDNLGIGVMDPTAGTGEALAITSLDRMGFDVIGWNLASGPRPNGNGTPIPEPESLALLGVGLAALGLSRRRRG